MAHIEHLTLTQTYRPFVLEDILAVDSDTLKCRVSERRRRP